MPLKTIINSVTNYKPFVMGQIEMLEMELKQTIEVTMRACENGE